MSTATLLGHADYWQFLAGFSLLWLAWTGLRARRAGTADAPWIWLVWPAALAGAFQWQQLLVGCFGDSTAQRLSGQAALVAIPVLYFEFARRSAKLSGPLGAALRPAWSVVAGIAVVAVVAPDAETKVALAGIVGAVCFLVGAIAAGRLAREASAGSRALRSSITASALLVLHVSVAGPLHSASGSAEILSPGSTILASFMTALLSAAAAWWLGGCTVSRSEGRLTYYVVPAFIICVLLVGWAATVEVAKAADRAFRGEMKSKVLSAASGLDPAVVASLSGKKSDLQSPSYQALRRVLITLLTADPQNTFAYVMALKEGRVVFLADGEPEGSPDFTVPGEVYESSTTGMLNSLNTGEPLVEGPYSDAWGTWITAFAPIRFPGDARPLALLGLDVDVLVWKGTLSTAHLTVTLLVLLLCLATASVGAALGHSVDRALAESRRQYENVVRGSPNLVALLDKHGNVVSINERSREYLGVEPLSLIGHSFQDAWPADLRPTVCEAIEAGTRGENRRYELPVPHPDGTRILSLAIRPISDPDGAVEAIIVIGTDVTELFQARAEIQAQAVFLRSLLDTMPYFVTARGRDGKFTCCNMAAARFLGLAPEDVVGKSPQEILPPEVAQELANSEAQLLAGSSPLIQELQVIAADGRPRDVVYTQALYYDQDGSPAGFIGVGFDITERKQTERRLRESEERLRAITGAAMDAVIMMDERGNISFWNEAAAVMFGYSVEEALGKPVHGLLAPHEMQDAALHGLPRLFKSGTGPAVGKVSELPAIRKDGGRLCVELSLAPVRIGQSWHAVGILRDVTERRAAEEQRRLLSEVVQQSDSGVLIADAQGRPIYVNAAFERLTGLQARDARLQDAASLPSLGAPLVERIRSVIDGEGSWRGVISARRAGGEPYRAELHTFPVRQPSGEFGAIVCMLRDVSREEALEVQLRLAQKMTAIGQLAAGIAHEINTPTQYVADNTRFLQSSFARILGLLQAFQRLADSLERGHATQEEMESLKREIARVDIPFLLKELPQAAQEALEGLDHVAKIVRAMKEFSHPGGSEKQPTDINQAVSTTLTVSRNVWKYVADVEADLERDLPTVECLPGDIHQILLNLIVNAAHAIEESAVPGSGSKGKILIQTRGEMGGVTIRVADNGCGIPAEITDRIFEPFFTTKEVGKGTGQGLWIAHSLAEKHHGKVTFESEVGKGTTFTLWLPLSYHEAGSQEVA